MNKDLIYSTKDMYLGTLLLTNGFELISSERKAEGVYFLFKNYDERLLSELIHEFIDCTANVNLKKFVNCLTVIRKEITKHK